MKEPEMQAKIIELDKQVVKVGAEIQAKNAENVKLKEENEQLKKDILALKELINNDPGELSPETVEAFNSLTMNVQIADDENPDS